jgi:RimJ/RimL family protein N-acetyltransferase
LTLNAHDQPVGSHLKDWSPPGHPEHVVLSGRWVKVEPLSWEEHGRALFDELESAPSSTWTYMTFGPFADLREFETSIAELSDYPRVIPYAFTVDGRPMGFAVYLRVKPAVGVIEVGSIVLSPRMQRTREATEALYLMIRNVFDIGYRRCEWKCDDLNAASRSAAERLGFTYEGTFRQATHYKGRNRDTAWYSITDAEWPGLDVAFRRWLEPSNFDEGGHQLMRLRDMRNGG